MSAFAIASHSGHAIGVLSGQPPGVLYIRILGPLRVEVNGAELRLGPQQRVLLAALVLARGQIVSKEQLADALWSDLPRSGASITLRTHVLHLRRLLEPTRQAPYQRLATGGPRPDGGYCLRLGDAELDVTQFTQLLAGARQLWSTRDLGGAIEFLNEALGLWRGAAFADLTDCGFVATEARRLEELRFAAEEDRIELLLALGRHREAVCSLTLLLDTYPMSEGLWANFMLALYRSGRRADALAAYRQVYALLRDELGVGPGLRLQRLHQQVLVADPALEFGCDLARSAC